MYDAVKINCKMAKFIYAIDRRHPHDLDFTFKWMRQNDEFEWTKVEMNDRRQNLS